MVSCALRADFLTPYYDITFSNSADRYKRRSKGDVYRDFHMIANDAEGPVVFFGSKEYVALFAGLTSFVAAERQVFFHSSEPPTAPGCSLSRFEARRTTNWQYECAARFISTKTRAYSAE
jgi:hypothetical protein